MMFNYYKDALRQYFNFGGIATRKQFWLFVVANIIVAFAVGIVVNILLGDATWLTKLYGIFIFIPSWAIACRRMHDTGRSALLLLLNIIPGIGNLICAILLAMPSKY